MPATMSSILSLNWSPKPKRTELTIGADHVDLGEGALASMSDEVTSREVRYWFERHLPAVIMFAVDAARRMAAEKDLRSVQINFRPMDADPQEGPVIKPGDVSDERLAAAKANPVIAQRVADLLERYSIYFLDSDDIPVRDENRASDMGFVAISYMDQQGISEVVAD